jgi:DNA-binding CsgD family transcriptional regulator
VDADLRCAAIIGRDAEVELVGSALDRAAAGQPGTALVVCGEAGIGKSRLARQASTDARARGLPVTVGRASAGLSPMPFRALIELVAAALRQLDDLRRPALEPYRPALARLVPSAGTASPDHSSAVLAEGVVRLLGEVGGLVVVEDLHWADPETLSVVEYLADNVAEIPVVVFATLRDDEASPAAGWARGLGTRHAATIVTLDRLGAQDTQRLAAGCLGLPPGVEPPSELVEHVQRSADGLPLLVEDLIAAAARSGSLARGAAGWELRGPPSPAVPLTFADTVGARAEQLDETAQEILHAAAVLGRTFPWDLIGDMLELTDAVVLQGLRAAVAVALIVVEDDEFRFRHALTVDAVLESLLPPERARLSRTAAEAVQAAHPDLEDSWCVLAADLRAAAGQRLEAAALLLTAGQRAIADGAVAGAAVLLQEATDLAGGFANLEWQARLGLLEAVAATGDSARAEAVGSSLLTAVAGEPEAVSAHLLLARAHLGARHDAVTAHLAAARAAARGDAQAGARVDALDALAVLESDRADRAETAERLAGRAVAVSEAAGMHEVACEALEVIGRCARTRDLDAAEVAFTRELQIAKAGGLGLWRIRALNELGTIAWLRRGDPSGVQAAHDAAVAAGAVLLAAGYSINLAVFHGMLGNFERSLQIARECEVTARRLGAPGLASTAVVCQAMVAAHRGRRAEMEALLHQAGEAGTGDMAVVVWGLCRSLLALIEEDRPAARLAFERADQAMRAMPALMGDAFTGVWLLLRLVDGDAGPDDLPDVERHAPGTLLHTLTGGLARAIVAGRAGDRQAAQARWSEAKTADQCPLLWHLCLRMAAETALTDGWGDPITWLLEVEAWGADHGLHHIVSASRGLLRQAGVTVGRSDPAGAQVPRHLRRAGVTAREAEVLNLVSERLTNREIAERLYLSSRTVEKHVASLMVKLRVVSRRELGTPAATEWVNPTDVDAGGTPHAGPDRG